MKLIIDISEYDREWIKNTYGIPQDIDVAIARAIINGKELPDHHGRLIDADALIKFIEDRYEITWESDCYEGGIKDACTDILEKIDTMQTIVEAEDSE